MHDHAFHRRKARLHVLCVGVGLQNVFALDVDAFERAIDSGVEHIGDTQAWFWINRGAPNSLKHFAGGVV